MSVGGLINLVVNLVILAIIAAIVLWLAGMLIAAVAGPVVILTLIEVLFGLYALAMVIGFVTGGVYVPAIYRRTL